MGGKVLHTDQPYIFENKALHQGRVTYRFCCYKLQTGQDTDRPVIFYEKEIEKIGVGTSPPSQGHGGGGGTSAPSQSHGGGDGGGSRIHIDDLQPGEKYYFQNWKKGDKFKGKVLHTDQPYIFENKALHQGRVTYRFCCYKLQTGQDTDRPV